MHHQLVVAVNRQLDVGGLKGEGIQYGAAGGIHGHNAFVRSRNEHHGAVVAQGGAAAGNRRGRGAGGHRNLPAHLPLGRDAVDMLLVGAIDVAADGVHAYIAAIVVLAVVQIVEHRHGALLEIDFVETAGAAGNEVRPGRRLVEHGIGIAGVGAVQRLVDKPLAGGIIQCKAYGQPGEVGTHDGGVFAALCGGKAGLGALGCLAAGLPADVGNGRISGRIDAPTGLLAGKEFLLRNIHQRTGALHEELLGGRALGVAGLGRDGHGTRPAAGKGHYGLAFGRRSDARQAFV